MASYKLDDDNQGWVRGWGVLRNSPWHLEGIFPTKEDAEQRRKALGGEYVVAYGSRRLATDDFVFASSEQP